MPLDRDRPDGTHIDLAVARRLASKPAERIGSMLVNPGGPGQSGTNRSSPVKCFTSDAAEAQFRAGVTIPTTDAESQAYQRGTIDLARRCGQVSGELLDHISTADTARDLDALRQAVGDRKLTYTGLSYGTMIGQTYANLFPDRVRAMMLDGLVDPVKYTASAESRTGNDVSSADEAFAQLRTLCQAAGPAGCALAQPGESVDERVARPFDGAVVAGGSKVYSIAVD